MNYADNWQYLSIKDCCKVISGSTPKRNKLEYWYGEIDWVTPKDLSNLNISVLKEAPEKITELGYKSCSTTLLPKGSILFSSRAPIGLIAIAGKQMCTNQGFKSLVPNSSIDSAYLYWCIRNFTPQLAAQGSGTTFKELSKTIVEKFKIPVPPLEEQKRIAAILDKADGIRRKRKEAIALIEELLRSTFLDMFGDPVTNPKGWKVNSLKSISDRIIDCPHSTPKWSEIGIVCLRTSNLTIGGWNWDDTRYITEEDYKIRTQRSEILSGDIILSREGTVGIAAIVPKNLELCMGQRLVQIRPQRNVLTSLYLLRILLWFLAPERLSQLMRGSTSKHLNVKDLRTMRVPVPPLELQLEFSDLAEKINCLKRNMIGFTEEQTNNFNSLLQKAFRGEL